tara:strand:- start:29586 stop:30392 length:807 start_codon:yes stop_codon:yes gene_type:complete
MKHSTRILFAIAILLPIPTLSQDSMSLTSEARGLAIALEASRRNEGYGDTTVKLIMELRSADGRTRERVLTWRTLEATKAGEGDKSLTIFHEPRDIAGTGFLSHTHLSSEDDQWLYLPSLKRVKRIASANMSGSFVGSEFSYEDLLSDEVEKFSYRWLREERCGEWECFVVERVPVYDNSGYRRQVTWIDIAEYRIHRTEFYDLENTLEKTLYLEDYRQYLNKFWRAHDLRMESILTGKTTKLTFDTYEFKTGLTEQAFSPDTLKRIR